MKGCAGPKTSLGVAILINFFSWPQIGILGRTVLSGSGLSGLDLLRLKGAELLVG